jgi:hypothetical protein
LHIDRIQIEDGFLDGTDVTLVPGLNVVIGARGTGKTSLIELIRFCLGSRNYATSATKQSHNHAVSVLGSGQITITLEADGGQTVVSRAVDDLGVRESATFHAPIIFSQTEIENVGLEAPGRLRLIDSFAKADRKLDSFEATAAAEIRSQTAEMAVLRREIADLAQQLERITEIDKLLAELKPAEDNLSLLSATAAKKKKLLDDVSTELAQVAVSSSYVERFRASFSQWRDSLERLSQGGPILERWTGLPSKPDPLSYLRPTIDRVRSTLEQARQELQATLLSSEAVSKSLSQQKIQLEGKARQLRKETEDLQKGAGATIRQAQTLRAQRAQLESLKGVLQDKQKLLEDRVAKRNAALDRLEEIRSGRYDRRKKVVDALNKSLGPKIRIQIERAGRFEEYAAAIAAALRGSGLRYADLSSQLAKNISPRELLDSAENFDTDLVAHGVGISEDRSIRVLAQLRESDLGELATCSVEDNAIFQLLDGSDYKDIGQLSTGQRCTVILPIILEHRDRLLIVDQPEDHIDNGFIADTLIKALRRPLDRGQIILSTHNANIPVLGEAQKVIHLGSDGHRGFVLTAAPLDDARVVAAITNLMEGGIEAFQKRASFYRSHGR